VRCNISISIGDALLKLGVDTKDLDKGLKGVKNTIQKHHKAIGLAMAAASAAIVGSALKSVQAYAKMGDEVQKMALRTGFSTEALSELRHAAEISGAELSTLEKGVKRMSSTILDAQDGMETYVRAFEHIGIKVEELKGLKPEEQFMKIAMAIAELEDETTRAAIAQDMFGRAGTELLPLFAQGAEGIAQLRQEAHELGIVFDQEAANTAAELTDAMKRLQEATQGVQIAIAKALIPTILPLLEHAKEMIIAFREWAEKNENLSRAVVALGLALAAGAPLMLGLGFLAKGLKAATGAMVGLSRAVLAFLATPLGWLLLGLGLIARGLWELWDIQKENEYRLELQTRIVEEHAKAVKGEANEYANLLREAEGLGAVLTAEQKAYMALTPAVEANTSAIMGNATTLAAAHQAAQDYIKSMEGMKSTAESAYPSMAKLWWIGGEMQPGHPYYGTQPSAEEWAGFQRKWGGPEKFPGVPFGEEFPGGRPMPSYATGAFPVLRTGLARVHAGETIIPANTIITIPIILDGEIIATKVVEHLSDEVKLQGGL